MTRFQQIASAAALLVFSTVAAHADTFYFHFHNTSGMTLQGSGQVQATVEGGNPNAFDVTSVTGQINGSPTHVDYYAAANSTNSVINTTGQFILDNVLYTSGNVVDYSGLLLQDSHGTLFNIFYDNGYVAIPTTNYPNETPIAFNVSATPEPSSIALLGTGLLSVAGMARRRMTRSL